MTYKEQKMTRTDANDNSSYIYATKISYYISTFVAQSIAAFMTNASLPVTMTHKKSYDLTKVL